MKFTMQAEKAFKVSNCYPGQDRLLLGTLNGSSLQLLAMSEIRYAVRSQVNDD